MHYNEAVSTAGKLVVFALLLVAACEKKDQKNNGDTGAFNAIDRSGSGGDKVDTTPLAGIDLGKLDGDKQKLFYKLVGSMKSPCGKPQSLRASFTTDTACKRAPYAVRYIVALLEDEFPEDRTVEEYTKKYEPQGKPVHLDVSKAPHVGADDAPVKLVEFYDYACPHCYEFRPVLEKVAADNQGKVVEYYMQFPLGGWPYSHSASQAALAANAQGKFKPMHDKLFEVGAHTPDKNKPHTETDVIGYAKEMGLDVAKFTADYKAFAAQVDADKAQGEAAGVDSTPTIFFNDRRYDGPPAPKYIGMWIDEENAVNR